MIAESQPEDRQTIGAQASLLRSWSEQHGLVVWEPNRQGYCKNWLIGVDLLRPRVLICDAVFGPD